jgi:hypothetical protein
MTVRLTGGESSPEEMTGWLARRVGWLVETAGDSHDPARALRRARGVR